MTRSVRRMPSSLSARPMCVSDSPRAYASAVSIMLIPFSNATLMISCDASRQPSLLLCDIGEGTHLDGVTLDGPAECEPCSTVRLACFTSDGTGNLHAPSDSKGTRRPLLPSRRKGMPLGSNAILTSVDIAGDSSRRVARTGSRTSGLPPLLYPHGCSPGAQRLPIRRIASVLGNLHQGVGGPHG